MPTVGTMQAKGKAMVAWAARWGFAVLVGFGVIGAMGVAWATEPPSEVPSFALRAAAVYRLEFGAAVFAAIHLIAMALVLALNNRAFSEIGTGGIRAQDVSGEQRQTYQGQQRQLDSVVRAVSELQLKVRRDASEADRIEAEDKQ